MKNEMIDMINEYGIDATAKMLAEYINQKIVSEDVAVQFVLEELEAASQGNDVAKLFATSSGFDEDDYMGAMHNSFAEVDGPNGPQQEISKLCGMLYPDRDLMVELRVKVVDNIMKEWKLGKYSAVNNNLRLIDVVRKKHNLEYGVFANVNNDLNDSIRPDHNVMILMAYGYARRTAAAGLYLQGVFNRKNYMQASNTFRSLQLQTGQSIEFQEEAALQAVELLLSYSTRLTRNMINKITMAVELDQVQSAYDGNMYFDFEKVLDFFE